MGITAVVLLASFAAQPPPPPPLLDEPTETAPEIEPQDPPDDEPEERRILKPKPGAPPPPEAPRAPKPPQLANDIGLDAFIIGALQWAVPCATAVVIAAPCVGLSIYVCPPAGCALCFLPAFNGYLAAYVGDRFGNNRAPAIWTVLAAYGASLAAVVAGGVLVLISNVGLAPGGNIDPANPVFLGGMGTAMLAGAVGSLIVPAAYALSAEPKRAGDDGSDGPGWFTPNHPTSPNEKKLREPADAPPRLTSMRF